MYGMLNTSIAGNIKTVDFCILTSYPVLLTLVQELWGFGVFWGPFFQTFYTDSHVVCEQRRFHIFFHFLRFV